MRILSTAVDRRSVCGAIVGIGVTGVLEGIPFRTVLGLTGQEFLIVNGWVLTREDVAATDVTRDVV